MCPTSQSLDTHDIDHTKSHYTAACAGPLLALCPKGDPAVLSVPFAAELSATAAVGASSRWPCSGSLDHRDEMYASIKSCDMCPTMQGIVMRPS